MKKVETLSIGQKYSEFFSATDETVRRIAEISGDINPIHLDDEYASKTIFKRKIAHGLFCINGISKILGNDFPGEGTILLRQEFNYLKPVYIDDYIETELVIQDISIEKEVIKLECTCKNQNKDIVLNGISIVKWSGESGDGQYR